MKNMLAKRTASAIVMLAACFALVLAGGWIFTIGVALIFAAAGWEYGQMFKKGGYYPSLPGLIFGNAFMVISSSFNGSEPFLVVFSLTIMLGIIHHILLFPKHRGTGGVDLAATLSGLVFIGFLGSYIIRLRFLPDGLFWLILAIVPAGLSDIGAYFIGSLLGRRKLAPDLSPNKTIGGYLGGVLTAVISGYAAGALSGFFNPVFNGFFGLAAGFVVGILCPLGDLGKSLFKRQFNLTQTSNLIPGHGGVLDRVDTLLWAGVTGYYLITFFLIK